MKLIKKFEEEGFEADCLIRAANRQGIEIDWAKGITPGNLTARFVYRLGRDINLNDDVIRRLYMCILGIYEGATLAINELHVPVSN